MSNSCPRSDSIDEYFAARTNFLKTFSKKCRPEPGTPLGGEKTIASRRAEEYNESVGQGSPAGFGGRVQRFVRKPNNLNAPPWRKQLGEFRRVVQFLLFCSRLWGGGAPWRGFDYPDWPVWDRPVSGGGAIQPAPRAPRPRHLDPVCCLDHRERIRP